MNFLRNLLQGKELNVHQSSVVSLKESNLSYHFNNATAVGECKETINAFGDIVSERDFAENGSNIYLVPNEPISTQNIDSENLTGDITADGPLSTSAGPQTIIDNDSNDIFTHAQHAEDVTTAHEYIENNDSAIRNPECKINIDSNLKQILSETTETPNEVMVENLIDYENASSNSLPPVSDSQFSFHDNTAGSIDFSKQTNHHGATTEDDASNTKPPELIGLLDQNNDGRQENDVTLNNAVTEDSERSLECDNASHDINILVDASNNTDGNNVTESCDRTSTEIETSFASSQDDNGNLNGEAFCSAVAKQIDTDSCNTSGELLTEESMRSDYIHFDDSVNILSAIDDHDEVAESNVLQTISEQHSCTGLTGNDGHHENEISIDKEVDENRESSPDRECENVCRDSLPISMVATNSTTGTDILANMTESHDHKAIQIETPSLPSHCDHASNFDEEVCSVLTKEDEDTSSCNTPTVLPSDTVTKYTTDSAISSEPSDTPHSGIALNEPNVEADRSVLQASIIEPVNSPSIYTECVIQNEENGASGYHKPVSLDVSSESVAEDDYKMLDQNYVHETEQPVEANSSLYNLDNLDSLSFNPFETRSNMRNSPPKTNDSLQAVVEKSSRNLSRNKKSRQAKNKKRNMTKVKNGAKMDSNNSTPDSCPTEHIDYISTNLDVPMDEKNYIIEKQEMNCNNESNINMLNTIEPLHSDQNENDIVDEENFKRLEDHYDERVDTDLNAINLHRNYSTNDSDINSLYSQKDESQISVDLSKIAERNAPITIDNSNNDLPSRIVHNNQNSIKITCGIERESCYLDSYVHADKDPYHIPTGLEANNIMREVFDSENRCAHGELNDLGPTAVSQLELDSSSSETVQQVGNGIAPHNITSDGKPTQRVVSSDCSEGVGTVRIPGDSYIGRDTDTRNSDTGVIPFNILIENSVDEMESAPRHNGPHTPAHESVTVDSESVVGPLSFHGSRQSDEDLERIVTMEAVKVALELAHSADREDNQIANRDAASIYRSLGLGEFASPANNSAQMNQSEAGPEVATGLTSRDLQCASKFLRDATKIENQFNKQFAASMEKHCKINEDASVQDLINSSGENFCPKEERSAPEGTSSPDPKSLDGSVVRGGIANDSLLKGSEVNDLLKRQEQRFEEKLLKRSLDLAERENAMLSHEKKDSDDTAAALKEALSSRDALLKLVEQYKGMLSTLVTEKERQQRGSQEATKGIMAERAQALEDLGNVEAAFSDVHRKYERTKQIVEALKKNEGTLKGAVAEYEDRLQRNEKKFIEMQRQTEEKINMANEEFDNQLKSNERELTKMAALLKKAEMKIISLQESLDRKVRENQELTQLCDDLISKVGS